MRYLAIIFRALFSGLPVILVTSWLSLISSMVFSVLLFQEIFKNNNERSIPFLIVLIVSLIILVGVSMFNLGTYALRNDLIEEIYKKFYISFGSPAISTFDENKFKTIKRFLQVKFKSNSVKSIERVRFVGSGGQISYSDLREFQLYLDGLVDSDRAYVINFDEIVGGCISAYLADNTSADYSVYESTMDINEIVNNTILHGSLKFPVTVDFPDKFISGVDYYFDSVKINLDTNKMIDRYESDFLEIFSKKFPVRKNTEWIISEFSSSYVSLKMADENDPIIVLRKNQKVTENIVKLAQSKTDMISSFDTVKIESHKNGDPLIVKVSLRHKQFIKDNNLSLFARNTIHLLNNKFPEKWVAQNNLIDEGCITFKKKD